MALLAPTTRKRVRKKLKKAWNRHGSDLLAAVTAGVLAEVIHAVGADGTKKKRKKKKKH